jgi:ribosomal protein S18 acetylase RimI-like enzyme
MTVTRRPESQQDEPFLRRLILDTIAGELGASAWPEPMRSHLLGIQYTARRQSHRMNFPEAASQVIEADGEDAGWTVVTTMPHEVRLVEIMVLPQLRGKGIGAAVIRGILRSAAQEGKPVRLTVNVTNQPAIRLYQRLGFRRIGGDEVQHFMEHWPPS